MSSSAGSEVAGPPPDRSPARPALAVLAGGAAGTGAARRRNSLATASLIAGVCGVSVVTIIPAAVLGVLGLRRAASRGSGTVRCWLGIGAAVAWAVLAVCLAPHLQRAADPGCTAYKGPGLTAYDRVIGDFNAAGPRAGLARDLSVTISRLRGAAARSGSPATARTLTRLAADLRAVLSRVRARSGVPERDLAALNRAAARADQACGTLRF